jgi:hypothetical protein
MKLPQQLAPKSALAWTALAVVGVFVGFQVVADAHLFQGLGMPVTGWQGLLSAMVVYFLSHVCRFVRFAMLMKGQRVRQMLQIYVVSAAASFALPFKLGELFRIFWIGIHAAHMGRGLIVVWVERILDATLIALIYMVVAFSQTDVSMAPVASAFFIIPLLIVFSILMLKVLPENMQNINLWVLRNYKGREAIRWLKWLQRMADFTSEARAALSNRALSLVMLTLCIWVLEILALSLAVQPLVNLGGSLVLFVGKMAAIIRPSVADFSEATQWMERFGLLQGFLISGLALLAMARRVVVTVFQKK